MKKLIFLFVAAVAIAWSISSCTYYENPVEPVVVPDSVFFSKNILPIFDARCDNTGCHTTGGIKPNLSPSTAYNDLYTYGLIDVDAPDQSTLYMKVHTGSMAKFTAAGDADLILKWIQQGALDN